MGIGGPPGGPQGRGRAPTLVARVWPPSGTSCAQYFFIYSEIDFREVSGILDSFQAISSEPCAPSDTELDRLLIRPFCIMLLYQYLLHYGLLLHIMSQYLFLFSLLLQGLHKEGECWQLGLWARKGANIRDLFCTAPKVLKLHG